MGWWGVRKGRRGRTDGDGKMRFFPLRKEREDTMLRLRGVLQTKAFK